MTFEEVFTQYSIHPKFWAGLQAYVMADARPDAELQVRLDYVKNFRKCVRDLKAAATRAPQVLAAATVEPFQSIEVPNEESD